MISKKRKFESHAELVSASVDSIKYKYGEERQKDG